VRADGRFNLFQRMMLRWRELHPYNPVHVVHIPQALDAGRLRACVCERVEALGLTGLVVDASRWRFRYAGGPARSEIVVRDAGGAPLAELSRAIEQEFNRPFSAAGQADPFRFTVIDEGGAFYLALAYDHFVAGGDSIARLLTDIALSYAGSDMAARPTALELYPATYRSVFLRHPLWSIRAILGLPRMSASARRAHRPDYSNVEDARNGFVYVRLDAPRLRALLGASKSWGVTLNDLLLASLMLALSPVAGGRRHESRRTELAVASIMNIRQDFKPGTQEALSPSLAAFRVGHPVPEGIAMRQLVQDVHAVTARIKREHRYLQSIIGLGLSALIWPLLTTSRRHRFYPKHYAVWAGVTTLNINTIWSRAGGAGTERLDYLRAVPTGPVCPMVLAATTTHDVMHIGIAFRTAAFSRSAVERIAAAFVHCIDQLPTEHSS
jgi:NRPS condensation-like uncharacterized protein